MDLYLSTRVMSTCMALSMLAYSVYFLFETLLLNPLLIVALQFSQLRDLHFKRFIEWAGPQINGNPEHVEVLQQRLLPHMRGTVLDIGPGTGSPLETIAPFVKQVGQVYGVEPNAALHAELLAAASRAGFNAPSSSSSSSGRHTSTDKPDKIQTPARYIPLQAGIEPTTLFPALASAGLIGSHRGDVTRRQIAGKEKVEEEEETYQIPKEGVFDAILSIRALCSSPLAQQQPDALLGVLHRLLKPGGQLLLFEHVANDADAVAGATQCALNTVWPTLIGGCSLRGPLVRALRASASNDLEKKQWQTVEIVPASADAARKVVIVPFFAIRAVKA